MSRRDQVPFCNIFPKQKISTMVSTRTISLFTGAFTLLNITRTENGAIINDNTGGSHPTGIITYSTNGYVSVLIHATEPEWRPESLNMLDQDERFDSQWALVGKHSGAYSGPFGFDEAAMVDENNGVVLHGPLTAASLPANIGRVQRREFAFSEDEQYLNLVGTLGVGVVDSLWWRRIGRRNVTFA
ncbi:Lipocalin-like domain-containing protein [Pseudomassariella vexata]|uniref:Lipocalin-like domain-domain-containing protein n=1 Tax=Pseudomassariella vexata TaxID=1141098 RepID=A0A1Y2DBQ9_9PEZI|nr:Lipocalin-like domain-containing protein [Pseudomassariella vexata]ORY56637.1 Lipocalin-like domain-domain-containing protein [Pseudomassariella vexata]